ncbi:MAG: CHAT domain-containing protein [Bacteroidales bacterium]|nr:CHAT domain-containing protein [Bacteroidales bacterium]
MTFTADAGNTGILPQPLPFSPALYLNHSFPQNTYNQQAESIILLIDSLNYQQGELADSLLSIVFDMVADNQISDSILRANIYHRQGKYLVQHQMYNKALTAFDRSVSIKQTFSTPDSASIAQSINYKGITYMLLHNYDSAVICYNQVLKLLDNRGKFNRDIYDATINIAIINAMTGNFDNAYSYLQKSYQILQDSSVIQDSLTVAIFYLNYGLMATSVGKTDEAIKYYDVSERYFNNIRGERFITVASLNMNKGMNAFYNYDYPRAKLFTLKAFDIYLENQDFENGVPKSLYNLGSFSISTGNYSEALAYSKRGLSFTPENDLRLLLTLNLARSYNTLNQMKEADANYREALKLLSLDNISPTRATKVYERYAEFLLHNHQNDSGYLYLRKALRESELLYGIKSNQNAQLTTSIGDYFLNNKKLPDSALSYYNTSMALWKDSDSLHLANYNKTIYAKAFAGKARALAHLAKKTGDDSYLFQSEEVYKTVLNQMLSLSLTLSNENKLVLGELLKPLYQEAIGLEYQLFTQTGDTNYLNKAFKFAESAKSAALLASVNNQYALKTADLPDKVFDFENQLKTGISTIQRILADEKGKKVPDERKIPYYNNRLLALMNQYDSLIRHIEVAYPKYFQLKYNSGVVGVQEIISHLADDELFIEYELSDTMLYRLVLGKNGTRFDAIRVDSVFYDALTRLISIKNTHIAAENQQRFIQFEQDAHLLYNMLLGNAGLEANNQRITIVPDGLLGYLPFEMLTETNAPTDETNYRDLPYVMLHHPISYAPSGTLKYNPFFSKNEQTDFSELLAFAPKYDGKSKDSLRGNKPIALNSLPYAKKEALDISHLMHGKAVTDSLATKEYFEKIAGQYGLLHLAMHTLINDTLPMMSKLVFYDEQNDSLSPYLNIYEIYGLSLNAKQVTLSACNTGSGKFKRGEGIMSLARGFLFAGVPSIVMTLWEVQDESGALLMNRYYEFLKDGLPKDVAMQKAKIAVLKRANMAKAHPFYWSSYVLSGDTSPIVEKQNTTALWIGVLVIFGLVVVFFVRKQSLSRKKSRQ